MKLALCSIAALDQPLAAVAQIAAEVGLEGLEVTARPPHLDPMAGLAAAREAGRVVRAAGLEVTAYGSYLGRGDLSGGGETKRRERPAIDHVAREISIAAALETRLLRIWAESEQAHTKQREPPLGDDQANFAAARELIRAAGDAAAPHGITVVIERHSGTLADTPERIERLLAAIDRPNVALNYQVLDSLPRERIGEQPADAARLTRYARCVHLKNYKPSADPPRAEDPIGPFASLASGVLDYRAILQAVLNGGYDGPLAIEFLSSDARPLAERLAQDVAFVRSVLRDAGSNRSS